MKKNIFAKIYEKKYFRLVSFFLLLLLDFRISCLRLDSIDQAEVKSCDRPFSDLLITLGWCLKRHSDKGNLFKGGSFKKIFFYH